MSVRNSALVPTLSALRPLGSPHAPSIPCFLPTCNLWCRIGVRSFRCRPHYCHLLSLSLPLDIWVSIGPASASLHFRCEEVLISISFSPSLENEDGRPEQRLISGFSRSRRWRRRGGGNCCVWAPNECPDGSSRTRGKDARGLPLPPSLQPGIKVHCYAHEIVSTHAAGSVSVHEVPPPPVAVVSRRTLKQ